MKYVKHIWADGNGNDHPNHVLTWNIKQEWIYHCSCPKCEANDPKSGFYTGVKQDHHTNPYHGMGWVR